jgi:molecular chaperone DnaK (HSP70)
VFDLGGGTFDVSLLSIDEGVFRVLSTNGDTHLGGDDLDRLLVQAALADLARTLPAASLRDPGFQQLLRLAAEKCKIELSSAPEAEMHVTLPESSLQWRRRFTREEFEALARPLIERTIDACRKALADAKLEVSAIDEVVLVGGATRHAPRAPARRGILRAQAAHRAQSPTKSSRSAQRSKLTC